MLEQKFKLKCTAHEIIQIEGVYSPDVSANGPFSDEIFKGHSIIPNLVHLRVGNFLTAAKVSIKDLNRGRNRANKSKTSNCMPLHMDEEWIGKGREMLRKVRPVRKIFRRFKIK